VELAEGVGGLWVTSRTDPGNVVEMDPNQGTVRRTFQVGSLPEGIAVGPALVWVANAGGDSVQSINPRNNRVGDPVQVGVEPRAVAYGDNYFWVANSGDGTVSRLNPRTDAVVKDFMQPGGEPHGMVVHGQTLYVVDRTDRNVQAFDVRDGHRIAEGSVGNNPKDVAYADGKLWVTNPGPDDGSAVGTVSVLDAKTLKPSDTPISFGTGSLPRGVIAYKGSVWVALGGSGKVAQVDPATANYELIKQTAHEADGIAAGGAIWTVNGAEHSVSRIDPIPPRSSK
jgi:DNA-binding beta-propeller fold protein YncE